ncbi:MAG: hypothetical protein NC313_12395 [Butyrivibrio sp.]|nr:hypothetical protein [Butyrivibrio sp.]
MERLNRRDKNGAHRDKIVLAVCILLLVVFLVYNFVDSGLNLKRTTFFSLEELEVYEPPVIFLESEEGETYFISLDAPDNKHILDKNFWLSDYNPVARTFIYSNNDGAIYEYDLKTDRTTCLIDKDAVCRCLNLPPDFAFGLAHYYFEKDKISFVYGEYLVIYDVDNEEFIYSVPGISKENGIAYIYGWSAPETLIVSGDIADNFYETVYYEYDVFTGEKTEISDALGTGITLAWDKSLGSSVGYKDAFGLNFFPVLIWDTQNYKIKQLNHGTDTKAYLSNDNKYAMLTWYGEISCIRIEDESICEVYEAEDRILDIIW